MSKLIPPPLHRWEYEHDSCGVGLIVNIDAKESYDIVDRAITGLKNLSHRGAIDADTVTGDGAGILTQIPYDLFRQYLQSQGKTAPNESDLGVGVLFLPRNDSDCQREAKNLVEEAIRTEGLDFLAWREVPVDPTTLGEKAEQTRPFIVQALIGCPNKLNKTDFERRLFLAMKGTSRRTLEKQIEGFHIVSLSSRTLTYKGLLNGPQLRQFYPDLSSPEYRTAFALFHQRFATNTLPDWSKAQPFRMLAHNGEINTIQGNRNLMRAREYSSIHGAWGRRFDDLRPLIQSEMSDSASFDDTLHALSVAGRSALHGVAMMMPPDWEHNPHLPPDQRDFYRCHACIMEPWDGPAAIVFTDGRYVAAALDRNGLRPARYKRYNDGTLILASEAGIVPEWGAHVVEAGRLGPGGMLAVDLRTKRLLDDAAIKQQLAAQHNYGAWCTHALQNLHDLPLDRSFPQKETIAESELIPLRAAFGYDLDEEELVLLPMVENAQEPTASMGDDTPIAVLSRRPRLLYTYFRQRFAQVTNPPIDSLLETNVMSLKMYLGGRIGVFDEIDVQTPSHRKYLELDTPILLDGEFQKLQNLPWLKPQTLSTLFDVGLGPSELEHALKNLAIQSCEAVKDNSTRLLILSDRGVCKDKAALPMLLAVGRVHQTLIRAGLRQNVDLVCEVADARDVHHMATLLGFGANAIHPYLALCLIRSLVRNGKASSVEGLSDALANYRQALEKGLLKILAKMGISTLFSYQGAQIFEALGISRTVIDDCFYGSASPIDGIGYRELAVEVLIRHKNAYPQQGEAQLWQEGYLRVKKKGDGEFHGWNPKVVSGMNRFLRKGGDYDAWQGYKSASDDHPPIGLKDLLHLHSDPHKNGIPLDTVEPIEDIRCRFTTAGMSLGALSPEMHECLAIAMNRIGGKSNSGEGGEDPRRFRLLANGDNANSAIKQIASGRFGVTAEYLANAKEIEIKMAQGAKPGEGGQLPGHKVTKLIARLRFSVPGVTLISPPPHHDIYSIEDLAQLIFDLKEVNPRAKVCVKLVAGAGIGAIAAGVAKAYADVILISGFEGGTGASPLSSIKYAGSAWEIGLAEVHQVLLINDLRNRVTLRTDGGFKTGLDIVKAALLGAQEFNFGTAALIAAGCSMFRVCHLNTCPVGVATQREDLRAKFRGKPENIINYFNAVAEDVRRYLAQLGYTRLDDLIGHPEHLKQVHDDDHPKASYIDLSGVLHNVDPSSNRDRIIPISRDAGNDSPGHNLTLDHKILRDARRTITSKKPYFQGHYVINNTHRNIGTRLSGEIAYLHSNKGMPPRSLDLTFTGTSGQSFGAFLIQGIRLRLLGEAQDYVGKSMHAGEIIIRPKDSESFTWSKNIIIGNTCLYGATGGFLFAAGRAGERFAVRNSGGTAVVEGIGDHGCEYMTGGTVAVLGSTGRNFGAGMSGGLAFVYDTDKRFETLYNPGMVTLERLDKSDEIDALQQLITTHHHLTQSPKARGILDGWEAAIHHFHRVTPKPSTPEASRPIFQFTRIS